MALAQQRRDDFAIGFIPGAGINRGRHGTGSARNTWCSQGAGHAGEEEASGSHGNLLAV